MATYTIFKSAKNPYRMVDNHIECDCSATPAGKITGTMLGGVLDQHAFKSQFTTACEIFGLNEVDLTANPAVIAGKVLEDPLVQYAKKAFSNVGTFLTAEEIFGNRGDNPHVAPSDFEHPIFAGHADGAVITPEGEQILLEVKTTRAGKEWYIPLYDEMGHQIFKEDGTPKFKNDGVPDNYYWQVALYNEFIPDMQKDYVYFLVGFMDEKAYDDPMSWVPDAVGTPEVKPNVTLFKVHINREEVRQKLAQAEEWYHRYIDNGITPDYDPTISRDNELWHHLYSLTCPLGEIKAMLDRFNYLNEFLKPLNKEAEQLKKDIKTRMDKDKTSELISEHGIRGSISISTRHTLDTKRIVKDYGVNEEAYQKITTYPVFDIEDTTVEKKKKP